MQLSIVNYAKRQILAFLNKQDDMALHDALTALVNFEGDFKVFALKHKDNHYQTILTSQHNDMGEFRDKFRGDIIIANDAIATARLAQMGNGLMAPANSSASNQQTQVQPNVTTTTNRTTLVF